MLTAISSQRVVTPEGVRPATIWIEDGKIVRVGPYQSSPESEDFGEAVISPGVIDIHVHINEPGRTDWEGFETATRAAAAGGVTTLVDMPLNSSPVTTNVAAWDEKISTASEKLHVNCGFYGGLVPGNLDQLEPLLDAGALGIKAFLVHSGLDEFPAAGEKELREAMPILAKRSAVLLVHAELAEDLDSGITSTQAYSEYLKSRPPQSELSAIEWMIGLCRETGCRVHIVHLATAEALPIVRDARAEGLSITVETAPHYLFFDAESIPDGATQFKCAPPIRDAANREGLWQGLRDGTIDLIGSDHSPCAPTLKNLESGEFISAWGGIASLQWTLSTVWTGAKERGFSLEDVTRWLSSKPAQLLNLSQKGEIAPQKDADFVIWEPEATFQVQAESNYHRHKVTPYEGAQLYGVVRATIVGGHKVFDKGTFAKGATGQVVLANE